MFKKIILSIILILLALVAIGYITQKDKFPIVTAYAAKCACTQVYENGRSLEDIAATDLANSPLSLASLEKNEGQLSVTSTAFGLAPRTAQYKDGFGCVLIGKEDDYGIKYPKARSLTVQYPVEVIKEDKIPDLNYPKIEEAITKAFNPNFRTRSIVVLKGDTLIGERYIEGFNEKTPQLGWSMTKSWANTVLGMMVMDSLISIEDDFLFEDWANDERRNITLDNLLRMSSGLKWEEVYTEVSDATRMLFMSENVAEENLDDPLIHPIGEVWSYSSGTTNLLSGLMRNTFNDDKQYWQYPKERLFRKLNMGSAFIEPDEAGNFIYSSYGFASARDWGKWGLLYLNDGMWLGERLLPEGWVDYSRQLTPASDHAYGAHFWLNHANKNFPDAPSDMYFANGHDGQSVFILPSHDLVIVRLGLSSNWDANGLIKGVLDSFQ